MAVEVAEAPVGWEPPAPSGVRIALRWSGFGVLVVLVGALIAGGVVAYGAYRFAEDHAGRFLPGTVVDGVDVSGMTFAEAHAQIDERLAPVLDHRVTVRWAGGQRVVTPRELGASADTEAVLAAARAATQHVSWQGLVALRWQGAQVGFSQAVTVDRPQEPVQALAAELARELRQPTRNAAMRTTDDGWVAFTPHQTGRTVPVDVLTGRIQRALAGGSPLVHVPVESTRPETTARDLGQVLLVREADQRLYYYEHGELARSWPVSTGTGRYPTPGGEFVIGAKRYMPSWTNPAPTGWGAGMPLYIGPGIGNPLGLRALNWDLPDGGLTAIRFHGTQAVGMLGRPASHGCVRLSNPDVIELFDLIEPGTRIISVRA
jgi:lipoprotein-anchoring transpeptidase ErfK/SrfK